MKPGKGAFGTRRLLKYALQGLALTVITTVLVLIFTVEESTAHALRSVPWGFFPLLAGVILTALVCNGGRMFLLARACGYRLTPRQALATSMSTEFGVAASPAGVGGTAIRLAFLHRAGIPLSTASSMLGADVFLDLLYFFIVLPFGLGFVAHDAQLKGLFCGSEIASLSVVVVALPAIILIAAAWMTRSKWRRQLHATKRATRTRRQRFRTRLFWVRRRVLHAGRQSWSSFVLLFRRRRGALLGSFLLACIQWSCRYGVLPLLLVAFSASRNPLPLFVLQGLLFAAALLVVAPGGGGSVEILMMLILPSFVPRASVGVVLFLWRFYTYYLYMLIGGSVFFWSIHHMQTLFPREPSVTDRA